MSDNSVASKIKELRKDLDKETNFFTATDGTSIKWKNRKESSI